MYFRFIKLYQMTLTTYKGIRLIPQNKLQSLNQWDFVGFLFKLTIQLLFHKFINIFIPEANI